MDGESEVSRGWRKRANPSSGVRIPSVFGYLSVVSFLH